MQNEHNPSRAELVAWAAGLFDGEGCIAAKQAGKRGSGAQLRLGMNDLDVVERFRDVVGCGKIYAHKPGTGSTKPCHTWYVYEATFVIEILEMLLPWFGERRRAKAIETIAMAREIAPMNKRTHCPEGHPYEGENLQLEKITRGEKVYYARRCRICRNAEVNVRMRAYRARVKARAALT